jgi:hypothetical protein
MWCSTLTTVRLFVSHLAPRLLGSSGSQGASRTGGSKPEGTGNRAHPLVTFGSAPNKSKRYNRFDDTVMLNTVVERDHVANDVDVSGGPRSQHSDNEGSGGADDESEKAIMQTRTTTVTYGHSSNNHNNYPA